MTKPLARQLHAVGINRFGMQIEEECENPNPQCLYKETDSNQINSVHMLLCSLVIICLLYIVKSYPLLQHNIKGIVRFWLSGNRLSIGQMCCVLPTKARMWPIRIQSIYLCCRSIRYPLRGPGKWSQKW